MQDSRQPVPVCQSSCFPAREISGRGLCAAMGAMGRLQAYAPIYKVRTSERGGVVVGRWGGGFKDQFQRPKKCLKRHHP